ncbi:MAG: hypothetical protein VX025_09240 [Pseudomonadota bacterium]|nr:hypothetical protein [Pseudomonadota bacterium]
MGAKITGAAKSICAMDMPMICAVSNARVKIEQYFSTLFDRLVAEPARVP